MLAKRFADCRTKLNVFLDGVSSLVDRRWIDVGKKVREVCATNGMLNRDESLNKSKANTAFMLFTTNGLVVRMDTEV